jgi:hypothetical protein
MREVFMLIGRGGALLWADASSEDPSRLPDSQARWQAIWQHRDELEELAHSHPLGPLAFSEEDKTTMAALEAALGKTLKFSIVAPGGMLLKLGEEEWLAQSEPWWASLLRLASAMPATATKTRKEE